MIYKSVPFPDFRGLVAYRFTAVTLGNVGNLGVSVGNADTCG
jgi:hypothetical protein